MALVQSLQRKSAEERDGYITEIKDARQRQEDCDTEIEKIDERIAEELAKITDEKNNDTRLKEYASWKETESWPEPNKERDCILWEEPCMPDLLAEYSTG